MRSLLSIALMVVVGPLYAQTVAEPVGPVSAAAPYSLASGSPLIEDLNSSVETLPGLAGLDQIPSLQRLMDECRSEPSMERKAALKDVLWALTSESPNSMERLAASGLSGSSELWRSIARHRAILWEATYRNGLLSIAMKQAASMDLESAAEASAPKAKPVPLSPISESEAAKLANATGKLRIDLDAYFLPDYESFPSAGFAHLTDCHREVYARPRMALWSAPTEADAATAKHWVSLATQRSLLRIEENDWKSLGTSEAKERRFADSLSALFHIAYAVQESPQTFEGSQVVGYLVSSSKSIAESIRAYSRAGSDKKPDSRWSSHFQELKQSQYRIGDAVRSLVVAKSPLLTPEAVVELKSVVTNAKAKKALDEAYPEPAKVSIVAPVRSESRLARLNRWITLVSKGAVWSSWLCAALTAILIGMAGGPLFNIAALAIALVGGLSLARSLARGAEGWKAAASIIAGLAWSLAAHFAFHEGNHWIYGAFAVLMTLGGCYSCATYLAMIESRWKKEKKEREAIAAVAASKEWHEGIDPEIVQEVEEAAHLEVAIQRLRVPEPDLEEFPAEDEDAVERVSRVK